MGRRTTAWDRYAPHRSLVPRQRLQARCWLKHQLGAAALVAGEIGADVRYGDVYTQGA